METTPTERVAQNIKAELARRGLSQKAIGQLLNISQQAVSRRMVGAIPLDMNEVAAIAGHLGIDISELTAGAAA